MKPKELSIFSVLAAVLLSGVPVRAFAPASAQIMSGDTAVQRQHQFVSFGNSAEAVKLRRAYRILATGDHDYKGHRVKAMHAVEAAAGLLGVDLKGDGRGHEPQPLSDVKLREAQGLLQNVLGAAEVRDQKRIAKHINEAIKHINVALSTR